jgi:hypothetical protein
MPGRNRLTHPYRRWSLENIIDKDRWRGYPGANVMFATNLRRRGGGEGIATRRM